MPVPDNTLTIGKRLRAFRYRRAHTMMAIRILKAIERQKGPVRPEQIACCDHYAMDVIGSKIYAPWFY